ncbi:ComEA family DNA-binding protein [Nocardia sp. NPDC051832]|uniref:ComEA family DNA-binding protein n=1 Tax=Nocardia sp. NPDC051832 TaxID=3155673 RepID=UPI0034149BD7
MELRRGAAADSPRREVRRNEALPAAGSSRREVRRNEALLAEGSEHREVRRNEASPAAATQRLCARGNGARRSDLEDSGLFEDGVDADSGLGSRAEHRALVRSDVREDRGLWDLDELPADPVSQGSVESIGEVVAPGWLREPEPRPGRWDHLIPARFHGARLDPGRRGTVTLAALGVLTIVIAAIVVLRDRPVTHSVPPVQALRTTAPAHPSNTAVSPGNPRSNPPPPDPIAPTELVVSVVGQVHTPGLVRLPAGARVADALTAAGAPTPTADLTGLNLAQRLNDGDQVLVGATPGLTPGTPQLGSGTISAPSTPPRTSTAPTGRVNLNTATESDLDALPGVGPITARAILTWRTTNGPFTDLTQLAEVEGIGPARLARLRDLVRI